MGVEVGGMKTGSTVNGVSGQVKSPREVGKVGKAPTRSRTPEYRS